MNRAYDVYMCRGYSHLIGSNIQAIYDSFTLLRIRERGDSVAFDINDEDVIISVSRPKQVYQMPSGAVKAIRIFPDGNIRTYHLKSNNEPQIGEKSNKEHQSSPQYIAIAALLALMSLMLTGLVVAISGQ